MAAFTVWKFEDPAGAQHAAEKLRDCEREQLIKILDYAVVSWPEGASKPETDRHNALLARLDALIAQTQCS